MARCGACGKQGIRKAVLATVIERGKVVGRRVGADCCAKDGVLIVTTKIAPVVLAPSERKSQREVLQPFVDNLVARLKARKGTAPEPTEDGSSHFEGYTEALEDVIAMLKEGRS